MRGRESAQVLESHRQRDREVLLLRRGRIRAVAGLRVLDEDVTKEFADRVDQARLDLVRAEEAELAREILRDRSRLREPLSVRAADFQHGGFAVREALLQLEELDRAFSRRIAGHLRPHRVESVVLILNVRELEQVADRLGDSARVEVNQLVLSIARRVVIVQRVQAADRREGCRGRARADQKAARVRIIRGGFHRA